MPTSIENLSPYNCNQQQQEQLPSDCNPDSIQDTHLKDDDNGIENTDTVPAKVISNSCSTSSSRNEDLLSSNCPSGNLATPTEMDGN